MCLAPPVAAAAPPAGAARLLRSVARRYWPRLGLTYLLFAVENGLMLLQPLCLGRAIDGLVRGDRGGWWVLAAVYLAHAAVGAVRRVFDTRSFTAIYRDLAAAMVAAQRGRGVPVSRVATRSALSRSLVDFLGGFLVVLLGHKVHASGPWVASDRREPYAYTIRCGPLQSRARACPFYGRSSAKLV